ncbi:unnamed protein product [Prorocentrum cordatum]|uniref:Ion transport domain-containing protein n=1 Tax=Prorocentrum cordatum TaxID=2364126 RepID=A0ABN9U340_9DINO|nr:unnamed protein product [Polarella glacialis]
MAQEACRSHFGSRRSAKGPLRVASAVAPFACIASSPPWRPGGDHPRGGRSARGMESPPAVEHSLGGSPREARRGPRRAPAAPGPDGPAEFSSRQLEQLRHVVQDAIRKEVHVRLSKENRSRSRGCHRSRSGSVSLDDWVEGAGAKAVPVQASGSMRGKAADDPVAADDGDQEDGGPESLSGSPRTNQSFGSPVQWKPSSFNDHGSSAATMLNKRLPSTATIELSDSMPLWQRQFQIRVHLFVHSHAFDGVMGLVILASCAVTGIEVQLKFDGQDVSSWLSSLMPWLDSLFLFCFIAEAGLRVVADGRKVFDNPWFRFDIVLVTIGASVSWILMPIVTAVGVEDLPIISQILTLRVLRLLRTVRAFRTMDMFSEMCRLSSGLLRSARTMLSVCLLVMIAIFTFSVLGADLIFKSEKLRSDDVTALIVEKHFSSMGAFMLTLMQFANADSLAGIYYPLIVVEPLLGLYFLALWVVVTVALMNLITAVIVDSALALGREEAEVKEARDRKTLQRNIPILEDPPLRRDTAQQPWEPGQREHSPGARGPLPSDPDVGGAHPLATTGAGPWPGRSPLRSCSWRSAPAGA